MDKEQLVCIITQVVKEKLAQDEKLLVTVGVSARHVHLSKEHLETLFGKGYELRKKKELMAGEFAAEECVTLVGSKLTTIENVRILGPARTQSQVELARTDAVKLRIDAPLRESGNLKDSAPITLVGPKGSVTLSEGCIVAKRHIHMSIEDSLRNGIKDKDIVRVRVPGERGGILENVLVRVRKNYSFEMHIDTDEANAMGIKCGSRLEIIK